ncbi:hypothetical protein C8R43DRAFT_1108686 [Mycena crocata]|nr:hypothetical protein C8R43DRAFT_1108686 [Mycena crocata]
MCVALGRTNLFRFPAGSCSQQGISVGLVFRGAVELQSFSTSQPSEHSGRCVGFIRIHFVASWGWPPQSVPWSVSVENKAVSTKCDAEREANVFSFGCYIGTPEIRKIGFCFGGSDALILALLIINVLGYYSKLTSGQPKFRYSRCESDTSGTTLFFLVSIVSDNTGADDASHVQRRTQGYENQIAASNTVSMPPAVFDDEFALVGQSWQHGWARHLLAAIQNKILVKQRTGALYRRNGSKVRKHMEGLGSCRTCSVVAVPVSSESPGLLGNVRLDTDGGGQK